MTDKKPTPIIDNARFVKNISTCPMLRDGEAWELEQAAKILEVLAKYREKFQAESCDHGVADDLVIWVAGLP